MNIKVSFTLTDGRILAGVLTNDHISNKRIPPQFVDNEGKFYGWSHIADFTTAPEMGSRRSEKKTAAARRNGKLGGRPRKLQEGEG